MTSPLIGVLGASGAVGRTAVRLLHTWGTGRLRLGGRRVELARRVAVEEADGQGDVQGVDVFNARELAEFCAGCRVIVNCAGPSFQILDRVAVAARAAGADYVDPGGDAPVHRRLIDGGGTGTGRTALLTTGMMPGLSGLLPRWLAGRYFDRAVRLTAYAGGRGRLTPAGAADYLLSLANGIGEPLAAWRNGARVSRALEPRQDVMLPCFSAGVTAYPFFGPEAERLARDLGLEDASWYTVFEGDHLRSALGRLQAAGGGDDPACGAAELSRAAELDLFGREPYQALIVELEGESRGRLHRRTAICRATDAYELTGAVTAIAVDEIVNGAIAPGVHMAAEALDPSVVDRLRGTGVITAFDVIDGGVASAAPVEEGCL